MEIHNNVSLAILFFVVLFPMFQYPCLGQNSPEDYVKAHNAARAKVGVESMTWNDTVEAFAQSYANQRSSDCILEHSGNTNYGENIAKGYVSGYGMALLTGVDAVNLWVGEQSDYDYSSNTCAPGKECGHYTQVVWSDSNQLGCARVECTNGGVFVTCNYYPPGNYEGQPPY